MPSRTLSSMGLSASPIPKLKNYFRTDSPKLAVDPRLCFIEALPSCVIYEIGRQAESLSDVLSLSLCVRPLPFITGDAPDAPSTVISDANALCPFPLLQRRTCDEQTMQKYTRLSLKAPRDCSTHSTARGPSQSRGVDHSRRGDRRSSGSRSFIQDMPKPSLIRSVCLEWLGNASGRTLVSIEEIVCRDVVGVD